MNQTATFLFARIGACIVFCLSSPSLLAEDSFSVLIPDSQNKQLTRLLVETNAEGVSISEVGSVKVPFAPASIASNPVNSNVIVTSGARGAPQAAAIDVSQTGKMKLIQTTKLAHPSGYTSVDRSGRFFMTAHYRSGTLAVYRIKDDGSVGELVDSAETPLREAHCIATTPDNRFTYIPCVKNNNALFQYAFDVETGKLKPLKPHNAKPPAMFGPRHVTYHPSLNIAYLSNEQQLGVSVYAIADDGQLSDLQHATTTTRRSPFIQGERGQHASDLVLSSDGKRLYVAVRDFVGDEDSVYTFRVHDEGRLSLIARSKVGDIPWKLSLSGDGGVLLVSETGDSKLSAYKITPEGALVRAAQFDAKKVRDMAIPPQ